MKSKSKIEVLKYWTAEEKENHTYQKTFKVLKVDFRAIVFFFILCHSNRKSPFHFIIESWRFMGLISPSSISIEFANTL